MKSRPGSCYHVNENTSSQPFVTFTMVFLGSKVVAGTPAIKRGVHFGLTYPWLETIHFCTFSVTKTRNCLYYFTRKCMYHSSVVSVLLAGTKLPRPSLGYLTTTRVPPRALEVHGGLGGVHGGLEGVRSRGFRIPTLRGFFFQY